MLGLTGPCRGRRRYGGRFRLAGRRLLRLSGRLCGATAGRCTGIGTAVRLATDAGVNDRGAAALMWVVGGSAPQRRPAAPWPARGRSYVVEACPIATPERSG